MAGVRDDLRSEIVADVLVNAAGPRVAQVISKVAGLNGPSCARMVNGTHIVVDRIDHDRAYIFQNAPELGIGIRREQRAALACYLWDSHRKSPMASVERRSR